MKRRWAPQVGAVEQQLRPAVAWHTQLRAVGLGELERAFRERVDAQFVDDGHRRFRVDDAVVVQLVEGVERHRCDGVGKLIGCRGRRQHRRQLVFSDGHQFDVDVVRLGVGIDERLLRFDTLGEILDGPDEEAAVVFTPAAGGAAAGEEDGGGEGCDDARADFAHGLSFR